jgi:signal transduction histidine kinase
MMRRSSLTLRLVLGAAVWTTAALAITGVVLHQLFLDHVRRSFDAVVTEHLSELIAVAGVGAEGDFELHNLPIDPGFHRLDSGSYWQVATPQGQIIRSASLGEASLQLPVPAAGSKVLLAEISGPRGERLRVAMRAVAISGFSNPAIAAVAIDTRELAASVARFRDLLTLSLVLLGLGLTTAIFAQVRFGLTPLRRMAAELAEIRSGRRTALNTEAPLELAPFAVEINDLLAQVTETIRRARTHVGNLAHGLKAPLAVLTNEVERATGPSGETLRRQIEVMSRSISHHLARARMAGAAGVLGMQTDLTAVVKDVLRAMHRIHGGRALQLDLKVEGNPIFSGERQDCEELLGNIIDNACIWAKSRVCVSLSTSSGTTDITIEDDGPGIAPEQRAAALMRGGRLDEAAPGTGLGLAIVAELVALHRGVLQLDRSSLGGLAVRIHLPRPGGPSLHECPSNSMTPG